MKKELNENQEDSEYTNILIKEIEKGRGQTKKKNGNGKFPVRPKIHKRGYSAPKH